MKAGVKGAEVADFRPASGIDGGNDHPADPGQAGALDDCLAVVGEGGIIEMDMAVDELEHDPLFVRWQRVPRS